MRFTLLLAPLLLPLTAAAEEIGSVDTAFKLLGANHKIVIEAFDDPEVSGVSCFVSRARTGGITVSATWSPPSNVFRAMRVRSCRNAGSAFRNVCYKCVSQIARG